MTPSGAKGVVCCWVGSTRTAHVARHVRQMEHAMRMFSSAALTWHTVLLGGTHMVPFTRERPYTKIPTAAKKKWIDQVRFENNSLATWTLWGNHQFNSSKVPWFLTLWSTRIAIFHCHVSKKVGDSKQLQLVGTPWYKLWITGSRTLCVNCFVSKAVKTLSCFLRS